MFFSCQISQIRNQNYKKSQVVEWPNVTEMFVIVLHALANVQSE